MKERPILFSGPMVRAILEGRKTQTRRVLKEKPPTGMDLSILNGEGEWICPYGKVGERLWVRENHYLYGEWIRDGKTQTGKDKFLFLKTEWMAPMFLDNPPKDICPPKSRRDGWYKKPSIHMRQSYSRISLKITDIRVERLQDISEEDAIAEGVYGPCRDGGFIGTQGFINCSTASGAFREIWYSINGKGSWDLNPWVWVIGFKKL